MIFKYEDPVWILTDIYLGMNTRSMCDLNSWVSVEKNHKLKHTKTVDGKDSRLSLIKCYCQVSTDRKERLSMCFKNFFEPFG